MGPLEKEIADFMQATLAHIAHPWASASDLKKWFFSQRERDMRAALIITGTTPEYRTLYNAFLERGNKLSTAMHIRGAAE